MNLFSYGTLQDLDVLDIVAGGEPFERLGVAWLSGHTAKKLIGENYPVLVKDENEKLKGSVITSSSDLFWKRIDFFEQDYQKKNITVTLHDQELECFIFTEEAGKEQTSEIWTLDEWQLQNRKERRAFLERCQNFMSQFGKVDYGIW